MLPGGVKSRHRVSVFTRAAGDGLGVGSDDAAVTQRQNASPTKRSPSLPVGISPSDHTTRRGAAVNSRGALENASNNSVPRLFPAGIDPSRYTLEQLAFISRKEQGIMPDNDCACCSGVGTLICTSCNGTGHNPRSVEDNFDERVRLSSNAMHAGVVTAMMREAGPCWICRGANHIACAECQGSGKRNFADNWILDE